MWSWQLCSPPTCVEEGVGVSADDDVDAADLLGDLLVHGEAWVAQSDDLIHAQRREFVHMRLQRRHLVLELQVRSWAAAAQI